ncbi:MAG: hypothetical protein HY906_23475 [Deltaproteobacteria bacterium]|nr:hypothetical protein [Deltaproteobacteria bacterium]
MAVALALACGCGSGTTLGRWDGGGAEDGAADVAEPDGAPPPDGAQDDAAPVDAGGDSTIDFCGTSGPIISVGDGVNVYEVCTNQIAENVFRNALCTCNNVTLAGYLETHSFDSNLGPPGGSLDDSGGAVGINNHYSLSAGYTNVGGSLSIAGPQSVSFIGYLEVHGDLFLEATATVAGYTRVRRNAWFGGDVWSGALTVDGDVHREGSIYSIQTDIGGTETQAPVSVAKPCDCDPSHLVDVTGIVDYAATHNDNAAIGLDPAALKDVFWAKDITLPCGRFYLDELSGLAKITVNVTDRVALFIGGDLNTAGVVEFNLSAGAEVDIFIKGNLVLAGVGTFGDKDHPARTRLYVGGSNDITLIGAGGFVGNVYAPRALVTGVGYVELYGSIFARDFISPGYAYLVYDRAIQTVGEVCDAPEPPAGTCTLCTVCTGGEACVGGVCGACTSDADCCGLEVCYNDLCVPLLL